MHAAVCCQLRAPIKAFVALAGLSSSQQSTSCKFRCLKQRCHCRPCFGCNMTAHLFQAGGHQTAAAAAGEGTTIPNESAQVHMMCSTAYIQRLRHRAAQNSLLWQGGQSDQVQCSQLQHVRHLNQLTARSTNSYLPCLVRRSSSEGEATSGDKQQRQFCQTKVVAWISTATSKRCGVVIQDCGKTGPGRQAGQRTRVGARTTVTPAPGLER